MRRCGLPRPVLLTRPRRHKISLSRREALSAPDRTRQPELAALYPDVSPRRRQCAGTGASQTRLGTALPSASEGLDDHFEAVALFMSRCVRHSRPSNSSSAFSDANITGAAIHIG
jgi:hypothetical protein